MIPKYNNIKLIFTEYSLFRNDKSNYDQYLFTGTDKKTKQIAVNKTQLTAQTV